MKRVQGIERTACNTTRAKTIVNSVIGRKPAENERKEMLESGKVMTKIETIKEFIVLLIECESGASRQLVPDAFPSALFFSLSLASCSTRLDLDYLEPRFIALIE